MSTVLYSLFINRQWDQTETQEETLFRWEDNRALGQVARVPILMIFKCHVDMVLGSPAFSRPTWAEDLYQRSLEVLLISNHSDSLILLKRKFMKTCISEDKRRHKL